MIRQSFVTLCGALLLPSAVLAETPREYFSVMGSFVAPDNIRNNDDGYGATFLYGRSINDHLSLELHGFGHRADNEIGGGTDYSYGGGVDLRLDVGSYGLSAFALAGLGATYEDFVGPEESSPFANVGIGAQFGLTRQLSLRSEARYYVIRNRETYAGENTQKDLRFNLGLQYAWFDVPRAPAMAAPIAPPPVGDADNDGVRDDVDQCPQTPAGRLVDAVGCPVVAPVLPVNNDLDGDGVVNALDRCPDTPPNFKVDANGCVVKEQVVIVLSNVLFEFDSATLSGDARSVLDKIAAGLKSQPNLSLEIGGHADALGSDAYNQRLSVARANAVRGHLLDRGIAASRLKATGYGESRPVASNDTDSGRALNRRVEFLTKTH